jgi:hypothetical protein
MRNKVIISNMRRVQEIIKMMMNQNLMISMMTNSNGTIRNMTRLKIKMISLMEAALHLV